MWLNPSIEREKGLRVFVIRNSSFRLIARGNGWA